MVSALREIADDIENGNRMRVRIFLLAHTICVVSLDTGPFLPQIDVFRGDRKIFLKNGY